MPRQHIPDEIMINLKSRLKELMGNLRLGRGENKQFAKMLGINPAMLCRWIGEDTKNRSKRDMPPSLANLINISIKVGIPIEYCLYRSDDDWRRRATFDSRLTDEENEELFKKLMEMRELMIEGMLGKRRLAGSSKPEAYRFTANL
jgi:hypothetical protein